MSLEKGAGSWRDAPLDISCKGFFHIYTYTHVCICVLNNRVSVLTQQTGLHSKCSSKLLC